jgi:starvation-inducible DNA-binding protein
LRQSTNGLTANYNNYSAAELEKALQSWVDPYPKPIILNHDLNSEPIGRVIAAKMDKEEDGSPYVRLQVAITDPAAAQKVADKRYLTGSVGGRASKAVCSITGEDLAATDSSGRPKAPKYKRGTVYKGKLAFIDMQDISFKEYSFVNQPADQRSSVRSKKQSEGKITVTDSEGWVAKSKAFVLHMNEEDIYSLEEHESILSNMKKKESRPLYLHMKGAFLSAVAIQESENSNNINNSLLSTENDVKSNHEENSGMEKNVEQEDILAAIENLSQDLSNIANASSEVSEGDEEGSGEPEVNEEPEVSEEPEASEEPEVSEESEKVQETENNAAAKVQAVLNEMIVLGFVAQRAHWNVKGSDFQEYHALFGMIYEDIFDSIDAVAEEIRKMGFMVENLTNMIMSSSFKDDATGSDTRMLTQDILSKNIMLNQTILAAFETCSEANEQGTADVLAARDGMHKKWSWQLRSSLGEEAGEPADESWREIGSNKVTESSEELVENTVDSEEAANSLESGENGNSKANLTGDGLASELDAKEDNRFQALQEENAKLKEALHRTLAERVVDTKISLGVESSESRDDLIKDHASRSASSLADSLRDLAKMPAAKKNIYSLGESIIENTVVSESEDNVIDEVNEEIEEPTEKKTSVEELFVDALMGRRKL